jgi:hypothetical protein
VVYSKFSINTEKKEGGGGERGRAEKGNYKAWKEVRRKKGKDSGNGRNRHRDNEKNTMISC